MRQEPDVYINGEPVCARFRVIITSCFACFRMTSTTLQMMSKLSMLDRELKEPRMD